MFSFSLFPFYIYTYTHTCLYRLFYYYCYYLILLFQISSQQLIEFRSLPDPIYPTRLFLFPTICILRPTAPLPLTRNPWIGGCHGYLGHMRGFPVARRRRRCSDQKTHSHFSFKKKRGCGWSARLLPPPDSFFLLLFFKTSRML